MNKKQPKARVLAYYLPQFHPIPENDLWWGKGFTEWTNVGKAKPLFPGHYQPRVPADLGYYDLRVPETRKAQADMAREYGVEGFVYWHYWFGNGKRLLERPFNEVLASGEPDFPFALAWANQTWSGTLHGLVKGKTLIEQDYGGDEDYIAHFYTVLPAFKDQRYLTCDDKPIFLIYDPTAIADIAHFIALWQSLAKQNGLKGIYFIALCQNFYFEHERVDFYNNMMKYGFDAINVINLQTHRNKMSIFKRIYYKFVRVVLQTPFLFDYDDSAFFSNLCFSYKNAFPSIIPNWDHSPRSGRKGSVMLKSSPIKFQKTLHRMVNLLQNKKYDERFIFIKSWNEWAEGNYLEPDKKYGYQWLDAIKNEILN
jgi:hypothetical protein